MTDAETRRRGRRSAQGRGSLTFAANLKRLRERDNLTQVQLNDALGLPIGTITRWEGRTHEPSLNQLIQVAAHFGIMPGELLNPAAVFGAGVLETPMVVNLWVLQQTIHIYPTQHPV